MRLVGPTAIESGESADALIDRYVENYKDASENEASISEPTHTDKGKPAEAATAPVVAASIRKSARNTDFSPTEARKWLIDEIDGAILNIPAENAALSEELRNEKSKSFDMKAARSNSAEAARLSSLQRSRSTERRMIASQRRPKDRICDLRCTGRR